MTIKLGEYLLIDYRAANGMFEKKSLKVGEAMDLAQKLANKFDQPFIAVKIIAVASPNIKRTIPAPSSPDASILSPAPDGGVHTAPITGVTSAE